MITTHRCAKQLYFANFQSIATYAIIAWGSSTAAQKLLLPQKVAEGALYGLKYIDSCKRYFIKEKILTILLLYVHF